MGARSYIYWVALLTGLLSIALTRKLRTGPEISATAAGRDVAHDQTAASRRSTS